MICSYFVTRKAIVIDGVFMCWEDEHPAIAKFLETEVGSVAEIEASLAKLSKEEKEILEKRVR
jgi:hypothetical protein